MASRRPTKQTNEGAMSEREPAQRHFVHGLLNWDLVRDRRERFSAIRRMFSIEVMEKCADSSPYYCHYMSWRLGTWQGESLFERLDDLISCAERLPNWQEEKRSLVSSADFADFWSLVWQLQVAEHLCRVGADVRWTKRRGGVASPDLSATVDGEQWFVECYAPRKSFGVLGFLEDILPRIGEDIRTSYDACLPFQLPIDRDRTLFLDEVLGSLSRRSPASRSQRGGSDPIPGDPLQAPREFTLCLSRRRQR